MNATLDALTGTAGGLLSYGFMQHAFEAGAAVAVTAGIVGYFVVLRRSAFAAHALSHIGFTGAAGGLVIGIGPVAGLVLLTAISGVAMGTLGHRLRSRDTVIGIVLAWFLGLGILFLSFYRGYATEAYALLFGQILGISVGNVVFTAVAAALTVLAVTALYRPLLFTSVDEDLAAARGIPVRSLSVVFMVVLALAISAAVQVVGVLLIFALLVAPGAVAERLTDRPHTAIAISMVLALAFTWVGLVIAWYVQWPVSFFITSLAFATYLVARIAPALSARARRRRVLASGLLTGATEATRHGS